MFNDTIYNNKFNLIYNKTQEFKSDLENQKDGF
jgi:hypothetical protein